MSFYYLSHLLTNWVLPPGLNLLLLAIGIFIFRYSSRLGKSFVLISFISLWLFCTPIVGQLLIDPLQNEYPPLHINQILAQSSSAIIVLGGGYGISPVRKNGYLLSDATKDRLHYAAKLYHQTRFPIVASGGRINKYSPSEAELMRRYMQHNFSIPVMWKENQSINTKDEGNFTLPILEKNNIKIAYLITNAWHIPRAMYAFHYSFRHTRIKIIAAPMGYIILQPNQWVLNDLPSAEGLRISKIAMHEYIGMLAYRLNNLF